MAKIEKALLSVSNKAGIVDFARELIKYNIQFISTGGTARLLRDNDIRLIEVSDYTGYPEMMDGRVKTLHPKIHGGLLGLRGNHDHYREMNEFNIECIDLIAVNIRPFNHNEGNIERILDRIDIGGIALIRSAVKNYRSVTVVSDPDDYQVVLDELEQHDGAVREETNLRLAIKALETTSRYDMIIAEYLKRHSERETAEANYIEIPR